MIGRDKTKQAELHAARMSLRADRMEEKLLEQDDQIDALRDKVKHRERQLSHLARGIRDLDRRVRGLAAQRARLAEANLDVGLLPEAPGTSAADGNGGGSGNGSAADGADGDGLAAGTTLHFEGPTLDGDGRFDGRPDLRLKALAEALDAVRAEADRLLEAANGDRLPDRTDAVQMLADRLRTGNVEERSAAEATSVADVCRLWIDAEPMARYQRELLVPYVDALTEALEERPGETSVLAAKCALPLLKSAFHDSATYLVRRSAVLDDYVVDVDVGVERMDQDPKLALDRFHTVVDQVRALGAVDFFHNLYVALERAVEEGQPGAGPAAWLLSDATVALLTDDGIKSWIATGMT